MKLAIALTERADIQRKISDLSERLNNNARVQEGDAVSENPVELMAELEDCLSRLENLIARINKTNNIAKSGDETITDFIARRDCLKIKIKVMRDFLNESSLKTSRYTKSEIRILSTVPVSEMRKKVDEYSKQLRETDEMIQELNWTVDLI